MRLVSIPYIAELIAVWDLIARRIVVFLFFCNLLGRPGSPGRSFFNTALFHTSLFHMGLFNTGALNDVRGMKGRGILC
jgi:hypothetical protein